MQACRDAGMAAERGLGERPAGAERGRQPQPQPQPRCAERELSPVTDRRSLRAVLCSGAERGRSRGRLCAHLPRAQPGFAPGAELGGRTARGQRCRPAEEGAQRAPELPQLQQPHTDTPSPAVRAAPPGQLRLLAQGLTRLARGAGLRARGKATSPAHPSANRHTHSAPSHTQAASKEHTRSADFLQEGGSSKSE